VSNKDDSKARASEVALPIDEQTSSRRQLGEFFLSEFARSRSFALSQEVKMPVEIQASIAQTLIKSCQLWTKTALDCMIVCDINSSGYFRLKLSYYATGLICFALDLFVCVPIFRSTLFQFRESEGQRVQAIQHAKQSAIAMNTSSRDIQNHLSGSFSFLVRLRLAVNKNFANILWRII
jgi:hypothetical protein